MIFKAVVGVARETPVACWADRLTACVPVTAARREWLERGLQRPKLVCPPAGFRDHRLEENPDALPCPRHLPRVVIAVDPHKASWTAVAVDDRLRPGDAIRVEVSRAGYRQLRRFAAAGPMPLGDRGRGRAGCATDRTAGEDGIAVVDVPAKLARRVRLLSTGHGRKTDQADALSVGIAAHTATRLSTAVVDEAIAALRALTEHRDDLVRTRTQTINRLHALLAQLIPAGLPRGLTADTAAAALRSIRPRAVLARTLRQVAVELLSEVRRLDRRIAEATTSAVRRGRRVRYYPDRVARHRRRAGREDPGPVRRRQQVPVRVCLRLLLRCRADRGVLR